jgi:hypothetical protein
MAPIMCAHSMATTTLVSVQSGKRLLRGMARRLVRHVPMDRCLINWVTRASTVQVEKLERGERARSVLMDRDRHQTLQLIAQAQPLEQYAWPARPAQPQLFLVQVYAEPVLMDTSHFLLLPTQLSVPQAAWPVSLKRLGQEGAVKNAHLGSSRTLTTRSVSSCQRLVCICRCELCFRLVCRRQESDCSVPTPLRRTGELCPQGKAGNNGNCEKCAGGSEPAGGDQGDGSDPMTGGKRW